MWNIRTKFFEHVKYIYKWTDKKWNPKIDLRFFVGWIFWGLKAALWARDVQTTERLFARSRARKLPNYGSLRARAHLGEEMGARPTEVSSLVNFKDAGSSSA